MGSGTDAWTWQPTGSNGPRLFSSAYTCSSRDSGIVAPRGEDREDDTPRGFPGMQTRARDGDRRRPFGDIEALHAKRRVGAQRDRSRPSSRVENSNHRGKRIGQVNPSPH